MGGRGFFNVASREHGTQREVGAEHCSMSWGGDGGVEQVEGRGSIRDLLTKSLGFHFSLMNMIPMMALAGKSQAQRRGVRLLPGRGRLSPTLSHLHMFCIFLRSWELAPLQPQPLRLEEGTFQNLLWECS